MLRRLFHSSFSSLLAGTRTAPAAPPSSSVALWPAMMGASSIFTNVLLASQQRKPSPNALSSPAATTIRHRSSRSTRGLYDGRDVSFGNNVPFSLKKTRRKWSPNVQHKVLYSEILNESIKFKVTTSALRSIDKMGGLDNYLLASKHVINNKAQGRGRKTGKEGMGQQVRNRIVQKLKHYERLKKEAIKKNNGEDVVGEWDRIILVGKKIKQQQQDQTLSSSSELEDNVVVASSSS